MINVEVLLRILAKTKISRIIFERFGVLIPPHRCEICGNLHWTYTSAVRCSLGLFSGMLTETP